MPVPSMPVATRKVITGRILRLPAHTLCAGKERGKRGRAEPQAGHEEEEEHMEVR